MVVQGQRPVRTFEIARRLEKGSHSQNFDRVTWKVQWKCSRMLSSGSFHLHDIIRSILFAKFQNFFKSSSVKYGFNAFLFPNKIQFWRPVTIFWIWNFKKHLPGICFSFKLWSKRSCRELFNKQGHEFYSFDIWVGLNMLVPCSDKCPSNFGNFVET